MTDSTDIDYDAMILDHALEQFERAQRPRTRAFWANRIRQLIEALTDEELFQSMSRHADLDVRGLIDAVRLINRE